VTIALAISGLDGVVIAADRQETAGYQKTEEGKIVSNWRAQPPGYLITTGAGDAAHIDAVASRLRKWFRDSKETDLNKAAADLEALHHAFYREKVIPIADDPRLRPDYSLLLAYKCEGRAEIFKTSGLSFGVSQLYEAVGIGETTAKTILQKLWIPAPVHEILNLATYTLQEVKASVDGCGLGTDIVFVRNEPFTNFVPQRLEPDELHEMEELFRLYRKVERNNFHDCVAHTVSEHTEKIMQRAEEYRSKLKDAFQKIIDKRLIQFGLKPLTSQESEQKP
jgi:20S proteasome alpha/beta subunit